MIDRYTLPFWKNLWSDQHKFETYLRVELANIHALSTRGMIDATTVKKINKVTFTLENIQQLELVLKHDVLAFVDACRLSLGEEKRWFHFGLTSSDVIDTAHSLLFVDANRKIHQTIQVLKSTLHQLALRFQHTPIMARTHGMYAEKTSFGVRFALWFDDLIRLEKSIEEASKGVEVCKLSGSIGTYPILPPEHEQLVAQQLGLSVSSIHTQILQRDRHSTYVNALAVLASWVEKVVLDIRLLSRSDVGEVAEGFAAKQKGSSAMPHKRNPIKSENLTGLARLMRSYAQAVMENQALWHERDISHSSVERVVLMDATTLIDYMLLGVDNLLNNLEVFPEVMQQHIEESYDVWMSQYVLHTCILTGLDREVAYRHLQTLSFQAMQEKQSLLMLLKQHEFFSGLPWKTLEKEIDPFKNIAVLYERVFG